MFYHICLRIKQNVLSWRQLIDSSHNIWTCKTLGDNVSNAWKKWKLIYKHPHFCPYGVQEIRHDKAIYVKNVFNVNTELFWFLVFYEKRVILMDIVVEILQEHVRRELKRGDK